MTENLDWLPLAEFDRFARDGIEEARARMAEWKTARQQRFAAERAAGKTVEQIATETGLKPVTVYAVLNPPKKKPKV